MATSTSEGEAAESVASDVTPKCRIIANQTAEIVTLQHKLSRYEGIENRFEEYRNQCKAIQSEKAALQEIWFNDKIESKELKSTITHLRRLMDEKEYILKEHDQDNQIALESLQRLHSLQLSRATKRLTTLECQMDVVQHQHSMAMKQKLGLHATKYDTLSAKYKFISAQNKMLYQQLNHYKTRMELAMEQSTVHQKYEPIIVSLLEDNHSLQQRLDTLTTKCREALNQKHDTLLQVHDQNVEIRKMYDNLTAICHDQDSKIQRLTARTDKLNAIIEHHDIQNDKMQQCFQRDIASKERQIVKLETQLEAVTSNSTQHRNVHDSLKETEKMLKEQVATLKNERVLSQQHIEHIEDKLATKEEYIETLRRQISEQNETISNLHQEAADKQSKLKDSNGKEAQIQNKYALLQQKTFKLAQKLKTTMADKKKLKRLHSESKQRVQEMLKENERIERATDKQCDAAQSSLENYKTKIHRKNQQLKELQEALNQSDKEKAVYQQRVLDLEKENEKHQFALQLLEDDNNAQIQAIDRRQKHRVSVLDRVIQENNYSQQQCDEILQDIADDDTQEDPHSVHNRNGNGNGNGQDVDDGGEENEDIDLSVNEGDGNGSSGRKRRRSLVMDDEDEDEVEDLQPVSKKPRYQGSKKKESSTTPFKAGRAMYKARKQRTKKNANLPKPRIN